MCVSVCVCVCVITDYSPTDLMAMRVPLCQVLVRFLPRMLMSTFMVSSLRERLGWVGVEGL